MIVLFQIVAVARNSEGEVQASAMLDVFQKKDFRQVKLKPTSFKTIEELQEREIGWQKVSNVLSDMEGR